MHNKLISTLTATLLASIIGIGFIQALGIPLKDVIAGIVVGSLYGLVLVIYLLRFAFIFIGVFTLYRILQKHHNKQAAV